MTIFVRPLGKSPSDARERFGLVGLEAEDIERPYGQKARSQLLAISPRCFFRNAMVRLQARSAASLW